MMIENDNIASGSEDNNDAEFTVSNEMLQEFGYEPKAANPNPETDQQSQASEINQSLNNVDGGDGNEEKNGEIDQQAQDKATLSENQRPDDMPQAWGNADIALWQSFAPEAKQKIALREAQAEQLRSKHNDEIHFARQIKGKVEEYRDILRDDADATTVINDLMPIARILKDGTQEQKIEMLFNQAKTNNIDLVGAVMRQMQQMGINVPHAQRQPQQRHPNQQQQQRPQQQPQQIHDPRFDALLSQIHKESEKKEIESADRILQEIEQDIDSFPYLGLVNEELAKLLDIYDVNTKDDIVRLYNMAVSGHPTASKLHQDTMAAQRVLHHNKAAPQKTQARPSGIKSSGGFQKNAKNMNETELRDYSTTQLAKQFGY